MLWLFLKIKLDKSHNALGHAAQLCRNDEYHVTAKAPHVFSVTAVVKIIWLLVHLYIVFPIHLIHIFDNLPCCSAFCVLMWELKMFHCGLQGLQSSIPKQHPPVSSLPPIFHWFIQSAAVPSVFMQEFSSFQPILTIQGFGHFSFLCLSLMSLPPHPWPFFHPSLNSVKGLLSITCTFIWGCAKSGMTDVEGRGLFWGRTEVAKLGKIFCLPSATKMPAKHDEWCHKCRVYF